MCAAIGVVILDHMPPAKITPLHVDLDFNSPLSDARAARIIRTLQPLAGARVVEIGCGWAELLLRIATSEPTVTCVGIDIDAEAIEHGRAQAVARGLTTVGVRVFNSMF